VVRHDSVTLERLSKSPYVYDIYGYCAFALIVPYMNRGNLDDKLREWRNEEIQLSSRQRMMYALDMARGLRDLHNIDGDGVVSATHGDLKEHQYLLKKDGRLVLGDFNKGGIH
jgi:serine/threonine protein kinase